MCPRCRQNAPIVYRGVSAYCTACGAPRTPLTSSSVNLAGQPSKVGGTVARVFGWLFLVLGTLTGLGLGAACQAIFEGGIVGYAIGGPIVAVSMMLAYFLLRGGRHLQKTGHDTEKATRNQAIFALANARGGVLTPMTLAQAIGVTPEEADATLTELAKAHPDYVTLDVDDQGVISYRFPRVHWRNDMPPQVRVDAPPPMRVEPRAEEALEDEAPPPGAERHAR